MAATITQERSRQRLVVRPAAVVGRAESYLYRSLQAGPEACREARGALSDFLTKSAAGDLERSAVLLCVQEALTNAMSHAGEGGRIGLSIRLRHGDLMMEVRDRGCGFDATDLDLNAKPDPMSEHGRGLFLMQQLMDEVQITSDVHGTTVRMLLHLS